MFTRHKICSILGPINSSLSDLPAPTNISLWWNVGSLLGMTLTLQLGTGLFLAMHYSPWTISAFGSISDLSREMTIGWVIRATHANGASLYFIFMYMHIGRGMFYGSYRKFKTWNLGVTILLLSMATAFVGYVLVWGQMSLWGATVITNLLSAIPYMGPAIVEWVWGGFAVENATLNRFFIFHFILPFAITFVVLLHLIMLHDTGSTNPFGLRTTTDKKFFHPFFSKKDLIGFVLYSSTVIAFSIMFPNFFSDPENFMTANPMTTPEHIKPEWYFLWAYAILRSIPNKLGGVIVMFAAILILYGIPKYWQFTSPSLNFYPISQFLFWMMVADIFLLTWIGGCPVEDPYILLGFLLTLALFILYFAIPKSAQLWDKYILCLTWELNQSTDF